MANEFFRTGVAGIDRAGFDAGLRAYMQRVFSYMGGGLALTGFVAFITANSPLAGLFFTQSPADHQIHMTLLGIIAMLAPFPLIIYMNVKIMAISAARAQTMFWVFCGLMGISMASLFLIFTGDSIARAFFITAATFGATSLYGYATKRDLTGMGAFMFMGVIGLVIAGFINLLLMSSMLQWMVSVGTVLVFTGLTAYQVQNLKQTYADSAGTEANNKLAVWGALGLYMSFINLFQAILQLTGTVRRN